MRSNETALTSTVPPVDRSREALIDLVTSLAQDGRDDTAQTAGLRVLAMEGRVTGGVRGLASYLKQVYRNIVVDERRWKSRDTRAKKALAERIDESERSATPPEVALMYEELQTLFWCSISGLPKQQRVVLTLRALAGLSLEEVSKAMQCPVSSVYTIQTDAIHALQRRLEAGGYDISADALRKALRRYQSD